MLTQNFGACNYNERFKYISVYSATNIVTRAPDASVAMKCKKKISTFFSAITMGTKRSKKRDNK